MTPPPRDGHGDRSYTEEPTPVEVPRPVNDHELLLVLCRDVRDVAREVSGVKAAIADVRDTLPGLLTRADCASFRKVDHPGPRRWLELALVVAGLVGALWGGWQWLLAPVVARVDRVALAAELRRDEPPMPIPIPVLAPVAKPADAAVPPPKPWPRSKRRLP